MLLSLSLLDKGPNECFSSSWSLRRLSVPKRLITKLPAKLPHYLQFNSLTLQKMSEESHHTLKAEFLISYPSSSLLWSVIFNPEAIKAWTSSLSNPNTVQTGQMYSPSSAKTTFTFGGSIFGDDGNLFYWGHFSELASIRHYSTTADSA